MVGLNPPIFLILAYGQKTSANRSLSHSKCDRFTIAKPIKAIALFLGAWAKGAIAPDSRCTKQSRLLYKLSARLLCLRESLL